MGDFRITTDTWRGKEVSYYLEPQYAAQARAIFGKATKPLVRFHYGAADELFDAVAYEKGGNILNMLRAYLGEEVFFQGLRRYLTQ